MIVVDVGCARYGGDYSIERLIEEFQPELLYGFDPGYEGDLLYEQDGCTVSVSTEAAWVEDGSVLFHLAGLSGRIDDSGRATRCIDLARFLSEVSLGEYVFGMAPGEPVGTIVLKIDAEGAEYDLLEHLIETGADRLLKLVWVEWHPPGRRVNSRPDERRAAIEERISCEMHQWNW